MALLKILQYPDKGLRRKGVQVSDFGKDFQKIIDDMLETHYAQESCAALAATQLDIPNAPHATVIDFSPERNQPLCLVNATLSNLEGEADGEEGCMSVGLETGMVFASVKRPEKITVDAKNRYGEPIHMEVDGFMAKCIQHELDHLQGVLFIDHLSALKRKRLTTKLKK